MFLGFVLLFINYVVCCMFLMFCVLIFFMLWVFCWGRFLGLGGVLSSLVVIVFISGVCGVLLIFLCMEVVIVCVLVSSLVSLLGLVVIIVVFVWFGLVMILNYLFVVKLFFMFMWLV